MASASCNKKTIRLGAIEAGGTHFVAVVAEGLPTNIVAFHEWPTTTPQATLPPILEWFQDKHIDALGIGSFGPVDLNPTSSTYGFITSTPKPGWRDTDILGFFKSLAVPIGINTDVNAAALGQLVYGQHGANVRSCCYVTVGTGIGVGVVINGKCHSGLGHPEGGHMHCARMPGDTFPGTCPYHKDCFEGMANSIALAARLKMDRLKLKTVPDDHPIWETEAFYLGQLAAVITLLLCPQVIVFGGGILGTKTLLPLVRKACLESLNKYVAIKRVTDEPELYIVPAKFGYRAGAVGALEVGRQKLLQSKKHRKQPLSSKL